MPTMTNFIDTKGACKMTYEDECRLRAQMLLDAADGVEFQLLNVFDGSWYDLDQPTFGESIHKYRRKPKKVRHERVLVWFRLSDGDVDSILFGSEAAATSWFLSRPSFKELKRETVWCEVEE